MGVPTLVCFVGWSLSYYVSTTLANPKSESLNWPELASLYLSGWGCFRFLGPDGRCFGRTGIHSPWRAGPCRESPFSSWKPLSSATRFQGFSITKSVPFRTVLEEKVNIIVRLWKIYELYNVFVVDRLPRLNFCLQWVDKVLLRQALVFAQIYLLDQVLLRHHFARNHVTSLCVDAQVSLSKTALPQQFVLYLVPPVYHFQGRYFLNLSSLLFGFFTKHLYSIYII